MLDANKYIYIYPGHGPSSPKSSFLTVNANINKRKSQIQNFYWNFIYLNFHFNIYILSIIPIFYEFYFFPKKKIGHLPRKKCLRTRLSLSLISLSIYILIILLLWLCPSLHYLRINFKFVFSLWALIIGTSGCHSLYEYCLIKWKTNIIYIYKKRVKMKAKSSNLWQINKII